MAVMARMKVDPASNRAVQALFKGAKEGVQNKVVKAAVGKAARAGAKIAKRLAPRGPSGTLSKSIATKYRSYRSKGVWVYIIGPRTRFYGFAPHQPRRKFPRFVASKYAHLAERGRRALVAKNPRGVMIFYPTPRATRQISAPKVGPARPRPFMDPAYRAVQGMEKQIIFDIWVGIRREAARYRAMGKSIYK